MKRRSLRFLVAAPALLVLGLAGCNQGSVGADGKTTPTTSSASSTQPDSAGNASANSVTDKPAELELAPGMKAIALSVPGMT